MAAGNLGLGGLTDIRDALGGGGLSQQQGYLQESSDLYRNIAAPGWEELYGGDLEAIDYGPTAYENIQVDPRYIGAANDALTNLQQISTDGGLTSVDKAHLDAVRQESMGRERAVNDTMLRDMGSGGGGGAQAQALLGQQASADRGSSQNLGIAAEAQARRMQAIQGAGQMGAGLQGQMYGQESNKAKARDVQNNYNAMNRQNVQGENLRRMTNARQGGFENQMSRARGLSGALGAQGDFAGAQNQANLQGISDIVNTGMQFAGGIANPAGAAMGGAQGLGSMIGGAARQPRRTNSQYGDYYQGGA